MTGEREHEAVAPGTQVGLGIGKAVYVGGHPNFANVSEKVGLREGLTGMKFAPIPSILDQNYGFEMLFLGSLSQLYINGVEVKLGEHKVTSTKVTQTNVCQMNPCLNEGACEPASKPRGFKCKCASGFSGDHCERPGHKCGDSKNLTAGIPAEIGISENVRFSVICDKNSMCVVEGDNGGTYKCLCHFNTSGPTCSEGIILQQDLFGIL